jgi:hypothetical protein
VALRVVSAPEGALRLLSKLRRISYSIRGRCPRISLENDRYIPQVFDRRKEAGLKRSTPEYKARRWVVEIYHSWFNRFRKLLVRYEKLERSFDALNHIAVPIIAFRKVPLNIHIFYGETQTRPDQPFVLSSPAE